MELQPDVELDPDRRQLQRDRVGEDGCDGNLAGLGRAAGHAGRTTYTAPTSVTLNGGAPAGPHWRTRR